jgi:hypothetical protein
VISARLARRIFDKNPGTSLCILAQRKQLDIGWLLKRTLGAAQ